MSATYQLEGDIAVVTLDRPESFNAITSDLSAQLVKAMEKAGAEARAAVITGSGKAFCAGADLGEIMEGYEKSGPNLGQVLDETFHPAVHAVADADIPTIAAVNGVAAGAGLGLALACDLRIMSESAFLMSAFAAIGLAPDSGTTWWLPHHVGLSRAMDITLTNRRVSAEEALDIGLCSEVVPSSELMEASLSQANALADFVPASLVRTRKLMRKAAAAQFENALTAERDAQQELGLSAEHGEGVAAFLEKRKPDYRTF